MFSVLLLPILGGQLHQVAVALHDIAVILPSVGHAAAGTILNAVLGIDKITAALVPQGIQGAVAEQAVELLRAGCVVAGEKLTFFMLEKGKLLALPIRLLAHKAVLLVVFFTVFSIAHFSPSVYPTPWEC
jgi:hypothetical protein